MKASIFPDFSIALRLVMVAAAALMIATAASAQSSSTSYGQIGFYGYITNGVSGQDKPSVRPATVLMAQDGSVALVHLKWKDWGRSIAVATGLWSGSDCTPDCADGKVTTSPVHLTLWSPDRVNGHEVYRCFEVSPANPKRDPFDRACLKPQGAVSYYDTVPADKVPSNVVPPSATTAQGASGPISFYTDIGAVIDGHNPGQVRPSTISLSKDGSVILRDLKWNGWGAPQSAGSGRWKAKSCNPSCTPGGMPPPPAADIALSDPGMVDGRLVYRCFRVFPAHPGLDIMDHACLRRQGATYAYVPVPPPAEPTSTGPEQALLSEFKLVPVVSNLPCKYYHTVMAVHYSGFNPRIRPIDELQVGCLDARKPAFYGPEPIANLHLKQRFAPADAIYTDKPGADGLADSVYLTSLMGIRPGGYTPGELPRAYSVHISLGSGHTRHRDLGSIPLDDGYAFKSTADADAIGTRTWIATVAATPLGIAGTPSKPDPGGLPPTVQASMTFQTEGGKVTRVGPVWNPGPDQFEQLSLRIADGKVTGATELRLGNSNFAVGDPATWWSSLDLRVPGFYGYAVMADRGPVIEANGVGIMALALRGGGTQYRETLLHIFAYPLPPGETPKESLLGRPPAGSP